MPNTGVNKPRVSDAVHPNNYLIRTEPEQGTLYSPEQTSLHESEGLLYYLLSIRFAFHIRFLENEHPKCKVKVFPAGFIPAGSLGNSRSSTQMNSYSDSGYQEAGSFHNSQNLSKADNRPQHSFIGSTNNHLVRNSRAEGQTLVQVSQEHQDPCDEITPLIEYLS